MVVFGRRRSLLIRLVLLIPVAWLCALLIFTAGGGTQNTIDTGGGNEVDRPPPVDVAPLPNAQKQVHTIQVEAGDFLLS